MRNQDQWKPTKFVLTGPGWRASRDPAQVSPASRLVADIVARRYEDLIPKHVRGRLLDHGCGRLPLYGMYKDLASEVIAVDWGNSLHPTEHMDETHDLNQPMPFASGSFDTIISSDVVEHLWNPVGVMSELARVLKPGGKIILNTPFNYWVHEAPHDYFRWSRYAIEELAERAGLHVVERLSCGGPKEVLADVAFKILLRVSIKAVSFVDMIARPILSTEETGDSPFTLGNIAVLEKMR
ncbi:class I SAM-dependent methyltransferase [Bradyrhizobium sp. RDM12]